MSKWVYNEKWPAYVRRIGAPRPVRCDIQLGSGSGAVWRCVSHDIGFEKRDQLLDGHLNDRCPVSRLEDWRARRWEANESVVLA